MYCLVGLRQAQPDKSMGFSLTQLQFFKSEKAVLVETAFRWNFFWIVDEIVIAKRLTLRQHSWRSTHDLISRARPTRPGGPSSRGSHRAGPADPPCP